jgi:DNA-binding transcriptional ArsR family regulator
MAVVDLLKRQPRRAGEIADALSLTPPALSRHLRVLRRSGLISEQGVEEDARIRIYRLRKEPFDQLRIWLHEVESFWAGELAAFSDHVDSRKGRRKLGAKQR